MAYKLTQKLVIRTGAGFFYNPTTGFGPGTATVGAVSFNAISPIIGSQDGGRRRPFTDVSNPFPLGFSQPTNGAEGLATFLGQSPNAIVRTDRTPYSVQWNFNVQYELPGDTLFDIAYAGNSGVKLLGTGVQFNQLPNVHMDLGDRLNEQVPNPFFGVIPDNTGPRPGDDLVGAASTAVPAVFRAQHAAGTSSTRPTTPCRRSSASATPTACSYWALTPGRR